MKREFVLLIFGIFLLAFIMGVYSLEITVNNPQDGQVFTLGSNEAGKYINVTVSTDEKATCKVYPGMCSPPTEGMSFCLYPNPVDLSTVPSKNHFKQVYYVNNPSYMYHSAHIECLNESNKTFNKQVIFSFQYSNQSNKISCGDTLYNNTMLTDDLLNCNTLDGNSLIIGSDNIILDCNGHKISGFDNNFFINGIYLDNKNNITIKNCLISDYWYGINLKQGSDNQIINNIIENYNQGLRIESSSNNKILNNFMREGWSGIYSVSSLNNTITNNTLKNNSAMSVGLYSSKYNKILANYFYNKGIYESYDSIDNIYCINGTGNFYFDGAAGPTCPYISSLMNTSWSDWLNISCLSTGVMNQSRNAIQYDLNNCPGYQNKTIFEYRTTEHCCYPNIINSSWNDWTNITQCNKDNNVNQSRYKTQYDTNSCNIIQNSTVYEYRQVTCNYCLENPNDNQCIFTLVLNSPKNGVYNSRRLNLDLTSNLILAKLESIDNSEKRPRWTTLCRNCKIYNRLTSFDDEQHNLTFRGTLSNGQTVLNQTNFLVDTKDPQISSTNPMSNKFSNGSNFLIKYSEDNLKNITLFYGTDNLIKSDCSSGKNKICSFSVNLTNYDNQIMNYYFVLIDIAGNSVKSRPIKVHVDTTPPRINNPSNFWIKDQKSPRYVNFNISITELNLDSVQYLDSFDGARARWVELCSRLDKNNICITKKYFKVGTHNLTIEVLDKAGNSVEKNINFTI